MQAWNIKYGSLKKFKSTLRFNILKAAQLNTWSCPVVDLKVPNTVKPGAHATIFVDR